MSQHYLIRPQHLNHHGTLFGGQMMAWADEIAFIAATLAFPQGTFVTKVTEEFNFVSPLKTGDIACLHAKVTKKGTTSVSIAVSATNAVNSKSVFHTTFILVNVSENGKSSPIPE